MVATSGFLFGCLLFLRIMGRPLSSVRRCEAKSRVDYATIASKRADIEIKPQKNNRVNAYMNEKDKRKRKKKKVNPP